MTLTSRRREGNIDSNSLRETRHPLLITDRSGNQSRDVKVVAVKRKSYDTLMNYTLKSNGGWQQEYWNTLDCLPTMLLTVCLKEPFGNPGPPNEISMPGGRRDIGQFPLGVSGEFTDVLVFIHEYFMFHAFVKLGTRIRGGKREC